MVKPLLLPLPRDGCAKSQVRSHTLEVLFNHPTVIHKIDFD